MNLTSACLRSSKKDEADRPMHNLFLLDHIIIKASFHNSRNQTDHQRNLVFGIPFFT